MAESPPETEWPTRIEDAPTTVVERRAAPVPPPGPPPRRVLDDVWPWLFGLALLVIAALVALWWFRYQHKTHHRAGADTTPVTQPTFAATTLATPTAKVAAPKLVGLKQADAETRLARAGLKGQARPVESLAASGTVVAQKPVPGTRVKPGGFVLLNVSRGRPSAAVPDVAGKPAPQAVAALRKAGFLTLVAGVPSTQPKGTVVAEAPPAGTKARTGSKVRLNISKGAPQPAATATATTPVRTTSTPARTTSTPARTTPAPRPSSVTVPTVSALNIFPAVRTLEQAGLHAQVSLVQSSQPAGRVISQQPSARSKATRGQVVQLNVSLGPNPAAEQTEVPDVTGQDVGQATQTLEQEGFTVQTVDRKVGGSGQDGRVVDEQPSGQAPQGFTIVLVVGRIA